MAGQYAYYPPLAGVTSLNGLTGALTLAGGPNITITQMGQTITIAGQPGTVTSVGLALPSIFTVSGSPVTSSGTLTGTLNSQTANTVFAGPATGAAAMPTFRALVTADLPAGVGTVTSVGLADSTGLFTVSGSPVTTAGTLTLASLNSQASSTFLAAPTGTAGTPTFRVIAAADVPTLNQNTTGTASNITATSNSTLTTLSALSLPFTQTTGSVASSRLAPIAASNFLTNPTGSPLAPQATTPTQATSLLNLFTSSLQGLVPASGGGTVNFLRADGTFATPPGTSTGTVTSVGLADSTGLFNITGSPVTTTGTLTLSSLQSHAANLVFATPNGASGAPTFRALVATDVPTLNQNTTGTAANITATSNSTLTTLSALSLPTSQLSGQVTLSQLPTIAADTLLGNGTGSAATPTALTATQVTALLNTFTTSLKGLTPASGGGTTNFLRADGTWAVPPGGGSGTVTSVAMTVPTFLSVTGSPITTSGTLAVTLSGTALPVANGGTGQAATLNADGVIYASSTTAMASTTVGTSGQVLTSNGAGNAPTFQTPAAASYKVPTLQKFTVAGSSTYTTPTSPVPLYIRVRMVGAGGGGGGGGATGAVGPGTAGGASTFGTSLLVAGGGGGGSTAVGSSYGTGGTASLGTATGTAIVGGAGSGGTGYNIVGYETGMPGGVSFFGGAGGGAANAVGGNAATNSGSGGAGGGVSGSGEGTGGGGGSGGYVEAIIGTPTTTYTYTVGTHGAGGVAGTSGYTGGAGADGYIEVTEYYQ